MQICVFPLQDLNQYSNVFEVGVKDRVVNEQKSGGLVKGRQLRQSRVHVGFFNAKKA